MTLILDHINGKNHDDRFENLRWVCPNCNQQLETTNGKNRKQYNFNYCVDCGKKISKKAIRCCQCSRIPLRQKKPVSREELKELIIKTKPSVIHNKSEDSYLPFLIDLFDEISELQFIFHRDYTEIITRD